MENDFLLFATDPSATVMSQADWLAYTRTLGFQRGILYPQMMNKALRQGTFMAAVLAQVMSDFLGSDVIDDGDQAGKVAMLKKLICHPEIAYSSAHTILATERGCRLVIDASSASVALVLPIALGTAAFPFEIEISRAVTDSSSHPITLRDDAGNVVGGIGPNDGRTVAMMMARTNGTTAACSVFSA